MVKVVSEILNIAHPLNLKSWTAPWLGTKR